MASYLSRPVKCSSYVSTSWNCQRSRALKSIWPFTLNSEWLRYKSQNLMSFSFQRGWKDWNLTGECNYLNLRLTEEFILNE
jgi:hypothetical protein